MQPCSRNDFELQRNRWEQVRAKKVNRHYCCRFLICLAHLTTTKTQHQIKYYRSLTFVRLVVQHRSLVPALAQPKHASVSYPVIQALLQDRDSCVKALLKAQEKASGIYILRIYIWCISSRYVGLNTFVCFLFCRPMCPSVLHAGMKKNHPATSATCCLPFLLHPFRRPSERASRGDGGGHPRAPASAHEHGGDSG